MDRREFLAATGAAAGLTSGWRVPLTDDIDKVGLQLYTVRREMETSVERTLFEVGRIGYREVEFAGYFGRPPRSIRQLLDRNGLKSPSAHVSLQTLRSGWFRTLQEASEMGQKWLVVPSLPEADRESLDALKRTADLMNTAANDARTFKIRVAFHNHDTEFQEVEGRRILDVLLDETDAELVDFEMDLYWIIKAGADPFDYFRRYPGRFPLLHVKDSSGSPAHEMVDVGRGTIDFARIFAAGKQGGFKHCYVEHDNPADPMNSARVSYRYLDSLEF